MSENNQPTMKELFDEMKIHYKSAPVNYVFTIWAFIGIYLTFTNDIFFGLLLVLICTIIILLTMTVSIFERRIKMQDELLDMYKEVLSREIDYGKHMFDKAMQALVEALVELENWKAAHPNIVASLNLKQKPSHDEVIEALNNLQNIDKGADDVENESFGV